MTALGGFMFHTYVPPLLWSLFILHEVRRTCRTCPATMKNVRRRAPLEFNQMSGDEVEMSGEAKKTLCTLGHL